MIISSEKSLTESLQQNLKDMEYECVVAADGAAAIQLLSESRPNIVAIDHHPPLVHASEILKEMRDIFPGDKVWVLVGSPDIDIPFACEAVELGVSGLQNRKIELRDLLVALDESEKVQKKNREKELQHSRLAMEYSRLKLKYEDLLRESETK